MKAEGQRPGTGISKASRDAQGAAKRKAGGREMNVDKKVKCPRSHAELGREEGGKRGVIDVKEESAQEAEKAGEEDVDQVGGDAAIDEQEGGNGSDDEVDAEGVPSLDAERGLAGASDAAPAALSPASEMPTGTPSKKQVVEGWRPGEKSVLSTGLDGEVAFACNMRTSASRVC